MEEKKEDASEHPLLRDGSKSEENVEEEQSRHGFKAKVESLANCMFGSCGEVVSIFTGGQVRNRENRDTQSKNGPPPPPPLSIADELRKLAAQEGRVWGSGPRAEDIPRFLGEGAVNSFDDDNISQISQHTLEDLMSSGDPVAHRRMLQQQHQQLLQHQHPNQS